ncbi:paraquat-inducible protein A, partial [Pseudomonas sp. HUK17]
MTAPQLPPRADELGLCLCHVCGKVCTAPRHHKAGCPRCGSALHRRKPNVYAKTWAYLIAALILYIPANTLPVMFTGTLGRGVESTILEGVIEFWEGGSWGVALVIFIASVAVPS